MTAVESETPKPVREQGTSPAPARLTSLDAYRGLVMLLMMAEALDLSRVAQAVPGSALWKFLAHHQSHAEWIGCSLHDLIQPSFSFLVGVALPFSLASRAARGQSRTFMTLHEVRWLATTGVVCLAAGGALGWLGVCPIVKRIWTPSWTLFSGGLCLVLMAGFYLLLDLWGRKRWSFPLVVIGTNSIAAYCIAALGGNFIGKSLRTHLAPSVFKLFGRPYEPLLYGGFIVIVMWLLLYWIYRRKLFLRI